MATFTKYLRTGALGDRIIASQEYRAGRDDMGQQKRHQPSRQHPRRPGALRKHAMTGRCMAWCLMPDGVQYIGDGPSSRR